MPAISYSNPDHLCPGRTIFVVINDPAGPFMLYIFGPAGPFMHPDHISLQYLNKMMIKLLHLVFKLTPAANLVMDEFSCQSDEFICQRDEVNCQKDEFNCQNL